MSFGQRIVQSKVGQLISPALRFLVRDRVRAKGLNPWSEASVVAKWLRPAFGENLFRLWRREPVALYTYPLPGQKGFQPQTLRSLRAWADHVLSTLWRGQQSLLGIAWEESAFLAKGVLMVMFLPFVLIFFFVAWPWLILSDWWEKQTFGGWRDPWVKNGVPFLKNHRLSASMLFGKASMHKALKADPNSWQYRSNAWLLSRWRFCRTVLRSHFDRYGYAVAKRFDPELPRYLELLKALHKGANAAFVQTQLDEGCPACLPITNSRWRWFVALTMGWKPKAIAGLSWDADISPYALMVAIRRGDPALVAALISAGASPLRRSWLRYRSVGHVLAANYVQSLEAEYGAIVDHLLRFAQSSSNEDAMNQIWLIPDAKQHKPLSWWVQALKENHAQENVTLNTPVRQACEDGASMLKRPDDVAALWSYALDCPTIGLWEPLYERFPGSFKSTYDDASCRATEKRGPGTVGINTLGISSLLSLAFTKNAKALRFLLEKEPGTMKKFWSSHHRDFCNALLHHFGSSADEEKSMISALQSLEALEDFPHIVQENVFVSLSAAISQPPEKSFSNPIMQKFLRALWDKPQCTHWLKVYLDISLMSHSKNRAFVKEWHLETLSRWCGWVNAWEQQREEEEALKKAAVEIRKEGHFINAENSKITSRRTRLV